MTEVNPPGTSTNSTELLLEECKNGVFYLTKAPSGAYYVSYLVLIVYSIFASLIGAVANLLVILAYFKRLRRHEFNTTLLAFLAAVDLLITAVVQPLMISRHTLELFEEHSCLFWLIIRRLFEFSVPVSFLTVGLITYERYQALFCPIKYRSEKLRRRIKRAMVAIWIFAFVTTCLRMFEFFELIYFVLSLFIITALVVANTVIYFKIGKMAASYTKDRRTAMAKSVEGELDTRKILAKDKRSTRTLFYIFLSLFICYLPIAGAILYSLIAGDKGQQTMGFLFGYLAWADAFAFLNSTLDPFIYCLRNPRLKEAVIGLICLGRKRRDSRRGTGVRNTLMLQDSNSAQRNANDSRNS